MRGRILHLFIIFFFINNCISVFSQNNNIKVHSDKPVIDSLVARGTILDINRKKPEIILSPNQAIKFLKKNYQPYLWKSTINPFRLAIGRLIFEASHPPYDSAKYFLNKYSFDSINIPWDRFYIWEPLRVKVPVTSRQQHKTAVDSIPDTDSNRVSGKNDSINLRLLELRKTSDSLKPVSEVKDTTIMVIIDTLNEVTSSYSGFPFKNFSYPFQSDSIKVAVRSLINYLEERDSSIINFTGVGKTVTPIMINSKSEKVMRYWLKNEFSDSVTIWIGNPSRNTIGLYLEQGVNFTRPVRQSNYVNAKINIKSLDNTKLLDIQNITLKSQFWKYRTDASFVLTQAALTNWVKGGESSVSTALDVTGYADYNNKALKLSSNNFARLKFGYLKSGKEDMRKNLDLLETNSKLNHKAFGKFNFSAILLFKTQLAWGYNYSDTSLVSKFMNPATITIGFGLDFKPNKTTSINFSPLSYKGTFVTDPAYYNNSYDSTKIDQTQYGVAKNKKSLNEPGVSFMISNEFKPVETVTIVNRLQLFTNYIHNLQNVDVDWEMIATAKLNWFTDVRFNTHLIFDDGTRTPEQYKNGKPVLRNDGTPKRTARIQFKEMLGFSLFFRF